MSRRFNINDNIEKLHVEIPKALIFEPKYRNQENIKGLSNNAKLLYGILLDKTYLSIFKAREEGNTKFIDENGDAFIYFDNASIEYALQISNKKAIQVKKELINFNLLEEVQQGLGLTNRLYLIMVDVDRSKLIQYANDISTASKATNSTRKLKLQKWREEKANLKCKNYTTVENTNVEEIEQTETIENTMKCKNYTTEMYNLHISKTDFSKTDSVVVVYNGQYKKIPNRTLTDFEKIQVNQNLNTNEKILEIQKIKNIDLKEIALLEKFIDASIFVSDAQLNMLKNFVYKIADNALDTTIAQGGETFSYFKKVYMGKEEEDINNMLDEIGALNSQIKNNETNLSEEDKINNGLGKEKKEDINNRSDEMGDFRKKFYEKAISMKWKNISMPTYIMAKEYANNNNLFCPKEEFVEFI